MIILQSVNVIQCNYETPNTFHSYFYWNSSPLNAFQLRGIKPGLMTVGFDFFSRKYNRYYEETLNYNFNNIDNSKPCTCKAPLSGINLSKSMVR